MKHHLPLLFYWMLLLTCCQNKPIDQQAQTQQTIQKKDSPLLQKEISFQDKGLIERDQYYQKYANQRKGEPKAFSYAIDYNYKVFEIIGESNFERNVFARRTSKPKSIPYKDVKYLIQLLENPKNFGNETHSCFSPKVVVMAYDEEGIPVEWLGICLDCNNFDTRPGEIVVNFNDPERKGFSNTTREALRNLFFKWGIDYYGFIEKWDNKATYEKYLQTKK